jgi:hypothetical protein
MTEPGEVTPVLALSFKLGPALPSTDNFAVALCRLLAATNDVIYLQKVTIIARARADAAEGPDKMIINNETGYCVRMLFGHLYEAGIAFRPLDDGHRDRIDAIIAGDDQAKEALSTLRKTYGDVSDTGFYRKILGCVRNLAGFHYKDATFKEGLEALKDTEATMIISEHIGFSRYVLSDVITTAKVMECVGGEANFHKALGEAYGLADALAIGVTHLLKDLFEKQKIATRDERGEVHVPPEIAETRRRVNAERKKR